MGENYTVPVSSEYQKNPEKYRDKQNLWAAEHRELVRARYRARHRKVRETVIAKYGGKCQCPGCDVNQYEFLAIDHIHGGGCRERREKNFPNSQAFYAYLSKNYEPEKYQVLCHNCNSAKAFYGGCPHTR